MLTPTLTTPADLFAKLRREQHRAFHAGSSLHQADHLYNFCVTALGLRDHWFVAHSIRGAERQAFHDLWLSDPARRACSEIANASKHGILHTPPQTQRVELGVATWVEFYVNDAGALLIDHNDDHPDITVLTGSPSKLSLYDFTEAVILFWRGQFFFRGLTLPDPEDPPASGDSGYQAT